MQFSGIRILIQVGDVIVGAVCPGTNHFTAGKPQNAGRAKILQTPGQLLFIECLLGFFCGGISGIIIVLGIEHSVGFLKCSHGKPADDRKSSVCIVEIHIMLLNGSEGCEADGKRQNQGKKSGQQGS